MRGLIRRNRGQTVPKPSGLGIPPHKVRLPFIKTLDQRLGPVEKVTSCRMPLVYIVFVPTTKKLTMSTDLHCSGKVQG